MIITKTDINPLHDIAKILKDKDWTKFSEAALIIGYHLKMAGICWETDSDLINCLNILIDDKFIITQKVKGEKNVMIKLNPEYVI